MTIPVGKVLGGTSSICFMLGFRGIVNDYQQWANAANDSSWEYRNLLPYFKRSERLQAPNIANCATGSCRGIGGTPPDYGGEGGAGNIGIAQDNSTNIKDYLKSFKEMGNEIVQDLSGRHSVGYTRGLYTIAEGYRQSTAYGYLVPAKKYPNLFVSKNTIVTKIIFDKHKNAIGVKASINGKKEIFLGAHKEVILSAGVIKSPQLLMLSGLGPRKHLEEKNITIIADLPVGENFQDQQIVTIMHKAKKICDSGPFNYHTYPASTVAGYKSLEPCAGIPDYATITFIEERLHFLLQFCALPFDFQYDICDRSYGQLMGRQIAYTQIIHLYPKSRGKVTLNTTNACDAPLIDTGYFSEEEDMNNLVQYVKDFLPIVDTTYFKKVNGSILDPIGDKCSDFEYGTDDYWKCYVYCMSSSMWNYGGTCSMGSVVDSKLKVYGVHRLRVVDASVMPIVVTGGNYVATVVIAEKASDMIKEEHQED